MDIHFRDLLYFPLGLIPGIFFTARMMTQWLQSERAKKSHITPLFWYFSFSGNSLLTLHYLIQIQFPFALIQSASTCIALRNLNLMQKKAPPYPMKRFLLLLGATLLLVTLLFALTVPPHTSWLRVPLMKVKTNFFWHLFGITGTVLFASRTWVQWWEAEKRQTSRLSASFFYLSLMGSSLAIIYFARIHDWVSLFQYGSGFIPYLRNLVLMRREKVMAK